MNDYKVTRLVSGLGYYCGLALIGIAGIAGLATSGFMGLIGGIVVGTVLSIPFLMLCEGMHALVTIANNTKPAQSRSEQKSA